MIRIKRCAAALCEITREQLQLPREKVIEGVAPVRSGVVRIAKPRRKGSPT